uniref:Uncharacterized protein n=1 Tax=Sphaerodactylus townsendi TaxID=933632 RepID=A0ACB8E9P6_9SAUR
MVVHCPLSLPLISLCSERQFRTTILLQQEISGCIWSKLVIFVNSPFVLQAPLLQTVLVPFLGLPCPQGAARIVDIPFCHSKISIECMPHWLSCISDISSSG